MPAALTRKKPAKKKHATRPPRVAYGWVPDLPDYRDSHWVAPRSSLRDLPARVDLRPDCPRIYNQGTLHSCTAHAIAAAIQFENRKTGRREMFAPSRLFIYYNERAQERSIHSDSGARIRTGIKTVAKRGVCHERLWPYRTIKFSQKPHRKCYREAASHPGLRYHRVRRTLPQMKACLASGYPFIFGFTVYESFHSKNVARTGRASMPVRREECHGGHAVLAVGYDEAQRRFLVRNSWGNKWGRRGYFTLPFDYLLNRHLAQDFWTIRITH